MLGTARDAMTVRAGVTAFDRYAESGEAVVDRQPTLLEVAADRVRLAETRVSDALRKVDRFIGAVSGDYGANDGKIAGERPVPSALGRQLGDALDQLHDRLHALHDRLDVLEGIA